MGWMMAVVVDPPRNATTIRKRPFARQECPSVWDVVPGSVLVVGWLPATSVTDRSDEMTLCGAHVRADRADVVETPSPMGPPLAHLVVFRDHTESAVSARVAARSVDLTEPEISENEP
jgi:hypothetical protein